MAKVAISSRPEGVEGGPPPYKLIVLDEADSMTSDAQSALRRTMETYSKVTRFCIICNYISRLIPPIASRCAKFRFKPLPQAAVVGRLTMVCENEGLAVDEEVLDVVSKVSGGDLRKAITFIQGVSRLCQGAITKQAVIDMAGAVPDAEIQTLLATLHTEKYEVTQAEPNPSPGPNPNPDWKAMKAEVDNLMAQGFSAHAVFSQLLEAVVADTEMTDMHKAKASIKLAEVPAAHDPPGPEP